MSETHLLRRYPENPILTAADFPRHVNSAFNAAAVKFNGQYLLLSWLEICHGVRSTAAGLLYRLGAVLLDLEQPWRVVGRASEAILSPIEPEDLVEIPPPN